MTTSTIQYGWQSWSALERVLVAIAIVVLIILVLFLIGTVCRFRKRTKQLEQGLKENERAERIRRRERAALQAQREHDTHSESDVQGFVEGGGVDEICEARSTEPEVSAPENDPLVDRKYAEISRRAKARDFIIDPFADSEGPEEEKIDEPTPRIAQQATVIRKPDKRVRIIAGLSEVAERSNACDRLSFARGNDGIQITGSTMGVRGSKCKQETLSKSWDDQRSDFYTPPTSSQNLRHDTQMNNRDLSPDENFDEQTEDQSVDMPADNDKEEAPENCLVQKPTRHHAKPTEQWIQIGRTGRVRVMSPSRRRKSFSSINSGKD